MNFLIYKYIYTVYIYEREREREGLKMLQIFSLDRKVMGGWTANRINKREKKVSCSVIL